MATELPNQGANRRRPPEAACSGLDRRDALRRLFLASAFAGAPLGEVAAESVSLPHQELPAADPEKYWDALRREQFLLADSRIFLNPGSLGVMPRPVLQAVFDSLTRAAEYSTDEVPRWGFEKLVDERTEMASALGCRPEELAFTHSCTEAMSFIANGIELQAGDEVLTTNEEHGSGYAAWQLKAARFGTTIRQVEIPITPKEPADLTERIVSAIGPKTRVLSFSGITSPTGLILPIQQICQAAREKGLITVVDGAHMVGQIPFALRELGCDYLAGSPHKWLFAPPGCGLLYGREDRLDRLWPSVVSMGWDNKAEWNAARFMIVGTNNRGTIEGMLAGLRFLKSLGETTVYQRLHHLARVALQSAQQRDYLEIITPDDSRFFQAMVTIRFKTDRLDALWDALKVNNIYTLHGQQLRLSMHVHTRSGDIQKFFEVCDQFALANK